MSRGQRNEGNGGAHTSRFAAVRMHVKVCRRRTRGVRWNGCRYWSCALSLAAPLADAGNPMAVSSLRSASLVLARDG